MADNAPPVRMTSYAKVLVRQAASELGVQFGDLFRERANRTPEIEAARARAVSLLSNEMLPGGKPRYTITQLTGWFGCSRQWIRELRTRGGDFRSRRRRAISAQPD